MEQGAWKTNELRSANGQNTCGAVDVVERRGVLGFSQDTKIKRCLQFMIGLQRLCSSTVTGWRFKNQKKQ